MSGQRLESLTFPPGVAHGFYFREVSQYLLGVSHYFDPEDEFGCHWADPDLGIAWPDPDPILSEKDLAAGSLALLRERLGECLNS